MRLVCYGDSWTAGHGIETLVKYKEIAQAPKFIERLRNQNSWPRWVAEKLDIEYINMGVCGYGNVFISNDIKETIKNGFLEDDDIIIVMFSYPYRYKKENYDLIQLFWELENELKNYKHFYFNSFFPTFKEEDFNTSKLPSSFINPNGCVSDILKEHEVKNNISVWEHGNRSVWNNEEKFWEGYYHPNLLGYKIIGDYVYKNIKNLV